jgi:hypothetical protein
MFVNSIVSAATLAAATKIATRAIAQAAADGEDSIFATIERYRASFAEFVALCDREEDDDESPEMVANVNENTNSRWELATTAPTTPAGLSALLDFVAAQSKEEAVFIFQNYGET